MSKTKKTTYKVEPNPYPIVYIIWLDHCSESGGWLNDSAVESNLLICYSVGYLIKETKEVYTISGDFCQPPGVPHARVINIGKKLVIFKKVLANKGKIHE